MVWHYITVTARGLIRHKLYSFINIAGLALGLACVILIVLFIRYETSFSVFPSLKRGDFRLLEADAPARD